MPWSIWETGTWEVPPACWGPPVSVCTASGESVARELKSLNITLREFPIVSTKKGGLGGEKQSYRGVTGSTNEEKLSSLRDNNPLQECFVNSLQNTRIHGTIKEGTGEQDGLAGWNHILGKLARLVMPHALFLFRAKRTYPLFPQLSPQLFLIIQCLFPFWAP